MRIRRMICAACFGAAIPIALAAQQWTADPKPTLDLKGVNDAGAIIFGTATWATRLADGTLVVADASGPALHFIDPAGKLIKSTGRSGQGPGDFRTVTWVAQCSASGVFAWDFAQTRVTTYDGQGTMQRTFPFGARGGASTFAACNRQGMFFAFVAPRRLPPPTPPDPKVAFQFTAMVAVPVVVSAAGDTLVKLGEFPYGEMLSGMIMGRAGAMPRPLGATTAYALGTDRLFLGVTDSAAVAVYSLDGKRVATIPVAASGRPPTSVEYAKAAEVPIAIYPAQMRDSARAFILRAPLPQRLPAFSKLLVDPSGLLWVQISSPGARETQFRVFSADGRAIAHLVVPMDVNVFEIGTDYILGSYTDADEEPHLTLFRLRRGR